MTDEAYEDLKLAVEWGSKLQLTDEQRLSLNALCCQVGGCVPAWRLKQEAEKRRDAEKRVAELELAMKSKRDEWVFRRGAAPQSDGKH